MNIEAYKMEVQTAVLNYRMFLEVSWGSVSKVMEELDWDDSPYFVDEWMQANWELLVEEQLASGVILMPYGFDQSQGARYLDETRVANHRVICTKENAVDEKFYFLCFTHSVDGRFEFSSPFDHAHVEDCLTRERFGIPLKELTFELQALH